MEVFPSLTSPCSLLDAPVNHMTVATDDDGGPVDLDRLHGILILILTLVHACFISFCGLDVLAH